jgi:hypothetical protein
MRGIVVAGILVATLASCQRGNPTSPSAGAIVAAQLYGYWADYQSVQTNNYVTANGTRDTSTFTNDYSGSISNIYCFDSSSLTWYQCLNSASCYVAVGSYTYSISGTVFVSAPFMGIDPVGTDTLYPSNSIAMSNGELIITTTLSGTLHAQPAHIVDADHLSKVDPFPPAYWPSRKCF